MKSGKPLRMCIGCGEMKPKNELIRIVKSGEEISLDLVGKKNGRGAYLCKNAVCFNKAVKAKRFKGAFGADLPEGIAAQIEKELSAFGK